MNKSAWKKPVALGLAFIMMISMTACGREKGSKGGSSDSSGKDYGDVKNMVFTGEVLDMNEIKGDPGSFVVNGDKIYFVATEWPEYEEYDEEEGVAVGSSVNAGDDVAAFETSSGNAGDDVAAPETSSGNAGDDAAALETLTDNTQDDVTALGASLGDVASAGVINDDETIDTSITGLGTADDSTEASDENDKEASNSEADDTDKENTAEETDALEGDADEGSADGTDENVTDDTDNDAVTDDTEGGEDTDSDGEADTGSYEDIQATIRIYSMNLDFTGITEICQPKLDSNEWINYLMIDKDGNIFFCTNSWDEKTDKQSYYIAAIDGSGNVTDHTDITDNLGLSQETYVSKMLMDDKNNLIVVSEQSVYILDSSFNKIGEVKSDGGWMEAAARTLDGNIVCGSTGEDGAAVAQVLDVENKKFGEKYKLDISYFNGSDALTNGSGEYDFYYKDDKGVFGYSIKDKKTTKIMDYVASEIDTNNSYGIIPLTADTMMGTGWDDETGKTVLTMYSKVDPSEVKDKTTITFGSLWGADDTIRSAAIKFNKENDKYRIEFKDYSADFETLDDAQSKINAEFATGNIPDIIDLNYMPLEQYVTKGILEDLTPYYDKDDTISKEDIIPAVEKAMEIDGKLYYVAPSFGLQTLIASKKDVGDKTGWTFAELKDLLEEKGEGVRPFYSENKSDIMNSFLYFSIDDYIDWTTGKCRFDSDDFKSVLEIASRGVDEEMDYSEDSPSQPELIKTGKVLFVDGWIDPESVQLYEKMYNTDITFIGYPCEDKQGSYYRFQSQLGIYSKSEVKEGAWEFIKTLMTKDYQASGGHIWDNPTNKDAFEMYMKTKTATEAYTDEYGNQIEPNDSSWGWDDLEVKIGPLSAEQEQMYRDLVNNTTKVSSNNESVMNIVTEEAKNFFSGQKGLDETADIIQNRVTTYVNENR